MDATLTLDEIDRHVSAIFDINVAATHCIRLVCQDCARISILPVPGPGIDEERPGSARSAPPTSRGTSARWRGDERSGRTPPPSTLARNHAPAKPLFGRRPGLPPEAPSSELPTETAARIAVDLARDQLAAELSRGDTDTLATIGILAFELAAAAVVIQARGSLDRFWWATDGRDGRRL